MAQGYVLRVLRLTKEDNGGLVPAVGWKVSTFVGGTSTPLTTYDDATLLSENTNPVISDADGFVRLYVAVGIISKGTVTDESDVPHPEYDWDNEESMVDPTQADPSVTAVPTGGILAYGGTSAPTGFLMCDGSIVSRATYDDLFAIIGTAYGTGDGMTTFGLPDLQQRFPLGKAASGTGSTLGSTGGAIDHTHTGPSHTHSVVVTRDGWGATLNSPSTTGRLNTGDAAGAGQFSSSYQPTADLTVTSAAGGTGASGSNNPAYQVVNFIIKT